MKLVLCLLLASVVVACSERAGTPPLAETSSLPSTAANAAERDGAGVLVAALLQKKPDWLSAQFIDIDSFPETITSANRESFNASDMVFAGVVPGTEEPSYLARVGVFENRQNQQGRFLVIFDSAGNIKLVLEDSLDGAAYSALVLWPGEVRWYKCFQCGDYEMLSRTPSGFVLD